MLLARKLASEPIYEGMVRKAANQIAIKAKIALWVRLEKLHAGIC